MVPGLINLLEFKRFLQVSKKLFSWHDTTYLPELDRFMNL